MSKETEEYIGELKQQHGGVAVISSGSALKFCLVAEGKADVYPRFGATIEWDTAAGQAIVDEAGGMVVCVDSQGPLYYNKENILNPEFIVTLGMTSKEQV